jgi:hypothetical protein
MGRRPCRTTRPTPQMQTPFWPRCHPPGLRLWEVAAPGRWHPYPTTPAHPALRHPSKICAPKNHPDLCPWPWCQLNKKLGKVNCTWLLSQYCFVGHFSLIARVCCECRKIPAKLKVVVRVIAFFSMPDGDKCFIRFFVALKPCIDDFLLGCKPYIAMDATHLTGRFRGQLQQLLQWMGRMGYFLWHMK